MDRHLKAESAKRAVSYINTKYPGTRDYAVVYALQGRTDNGSTEYDRLFPPGSIGYEPLNVYIGTKTFNANIDADGMALDEDCVWLAFQALHEGAHVWQHCHGFMQKDPDSVTRMAAMDSLAERLVPEYHDMAYLRNICELQADARATRMIGGVFADLAENVDPAFADIDVDGIVLDKERSRRGRQIKGLYSCQVAKDAAMLYDAEISKCLSLPRFDFDWVNSRGKPYSKVLGALCRDDVFVRAIEGGEGAGSELNAVCVYAGRVYPAMFNGLACIRDEYVGSGLNGKAAGAFAKMMRMLSRDGPNVKEMDVSEYGS